MARAYKNVECRMILAPVSWQIPIILYMLFDYLFFTPLNKIRQKNSNFHTLSPTHNRSIMV